ncbi:MAG: hypothetical protein RTV72_03070 [Candidatus Thorarchaeota archaeon]
MIASERSQNIIVVSVILVAVVSSGFLVNNAVYFGGSYSLAGSLNVSLVEIAVSNIDHTNESINPYLNLTFNLASTSYSEGNVKITFMGAEVTLNDDLLSYTIFSHIPDVEDRSIYPDFNNDYTMGYEATASDRQAILDADTSGIWNWEIAFRYSFIVFDEDRTLLFRWLYFNTTVTTIL